VAFEFGSSGEQGLETGETFLVINAVSFQFLSINPRVTAHTPIFEVSQVYNATRGQAYDIAGYQIIGDGNTIDLDETKPQNIVVGLASSDVIKVDYKFRSSDTFILQKQPVLDIVSVVGQLSGALGTDNYERVSLEDPLLNGGSTIAQDGVRIIFANGLPLTGSQTITDEPHVLILDQNESLAYLGVDPQSIVVKSTDHATTYVASVDYRIIPGTDTVVTSIKMIESGSIQNGQEVLVSYTAIENFAITYTTNDLLNDVQTEIDVMKHACADAVVKEAVQNKVDFVMTVVPKSGVTSTISGWSFLQSKIQTAVSNYISQLNLGVDLTQSEVIRIVQEVPDVSYVIVPFNRMTKADGSFITRDEIGQTQFQIFSNGIVKSYITAATVLTYKTVDKGGPENLFRGVFENKEPLVLQSDPLDVSGGPGRAYIEADGKIIVSTKDGQLPDEKEYSVAYYVFGETGAKDISVASLEYLTVGNFSVLNGSL
jgi:hypothetical protein